MGRRKRILATIDCETDPFLVGRVPQPFVWGYYDARVGFRYWWGPYATENFAEFLKEQRVWAYAHNGGKFDFHYLSGELGVGVRPLIINSRLAKVKLGAAELRDSWCIAPLPLDKIGEKLDFDYSKMEADVRELHKDEILEYLEIDCVVLHEYIERFHSDHGTPLTIASAAMKSWGKIVGKDNIPKTTGRYHKSLRPWYAGGRVEAREHGVVRGEFTLVDINSAYPYAMLADHPCGGRVASWRTRGCEVHPLDDVRRFYHVKARHGGSLWRREKAGLTFAPGEGEYHVTDFELHAGIETDDVDVIDVLGVVEFADTVSFGQYVDYWYQQKRACGESGDDAGRTIAKLFMNSLYGKFGSNPENYMEYLLDEVGWSGIEDPTGDWAPGPVLGEVQIYSRDLPENRQRYYDIATAASVTGYVRAQMWRAIHGSGRVLYCDTDSMIGSDLGVQLGPDLGEWDVEVPRIDEVAIGGKKLYAAFLGGRCMKQANKGVRISPDEIRRVALGETVQYDNYAPTYSFGADPRFLSRRVRATGSV